MVGGDEQVADRQVLRQRAGGDADGQHAHRVGEDGGDGLAAHPADRHGLGFGGEDEVADLQRLDRNLAVWGADQGAGVEADRGVAR